MSSRARDECKAGGDVDPRPQKRARGSAAATEATSATAATAATATTDATAAVAAPLSTQAVSDALVYMTTAAAALRGEVEMARVACADAVKACTTARWLNWRVQNSRDDMNRRRLFPTRWRPLAEALVAKRPVVVPKALLVLQYPEDQGEPRDSSMYDLLRGFPHRTFTHPVVVYEHMELRSKQWTSPASAKPNDIGVPFYEITMDHDAFQASKSHRAWLLDKLHQERANSEALSADHRRQLQWMKGFMAWDAMQGGEGLGALLGNEARCARAGSSEGSEAATEASCATNGPTAMMAAWVRAMTEGLHGGTPDSDVMFDAAAMLEAFALDMELAWQEHSTCLEQGDDDSDHSQQRGGFALHSVQFVIFHPRDPAGACAATTEG